MGQSPGHWVDPGFVVKQWTLEDGLPGNTVRDIHQSAQGYLWLATGNGLARFDGVTMSPYTTANTEPVPNNNFWVIFEPRPGELWFLTEQHHLIRYRDGKFDRPVEENEGRLSLVYKEPASGRFQTDGDTTWIGTDWGLLKEVDGSFQQVLPDVITDRVWDVERDSSGTLWMGTFSGELVRMGRDGETSRYTTSDGLPGSRIHNVLSDRQGDLWIGTRDGIFQLDSNDRFSPVLDGTDAWRVNARVIRETADGALYVGTARYLVDIKGEESGWYQLRPGEPRRYLPGNAELGFGADLEAGPEGKLWGHLGSRLFQDQNLVFEAPSSILSLAFDNEGNAWAGTEAHGLFRIRRAKFKVLTQEDGLPDRRVRSVMEDRTGRVWVGTEWGLARVEGAAVETVDLMAGYRGRAATYFPRKGYSRVRKPGDEVWGLYEDRSSRIWVGTNYEHCLINGPRCEMQDLGDIPQDLYENVSAMLEDSQGRFWIGSKWGLILGESGPVGKDWVRFSVEEGLTNNWIRSIIESPDGSVLFGSYGGGLMAYRDGSFQSLGQAEGLSSNNVLSLLQDSTGTIWVGTEDRGVCALILGDRGLEDATVGCVSVEAGLFDNTVYQIISDDYGRLWMSSSRGIFMVNRESLFKVAQGESTRVFSVGYTEEDGLRNRQGAGGVQPAGIRASDGRLWFATEDGVAIVDPASVQPIAAEPPVYIESALVGEKQQPLAAGLTLEPGQRTSEIRFTAIRFTNPSALQFRYRLDGFESEWRQSRESRVATYTNIPPGEYTFTVQVGEAGRWFRNGASLTVRQLPYFWETRWFLGLVFLAIGLVATGAYRYRIWQIEARNRELEERVEDRTRQIRLNEARLEENARELRRVSELKSRFLTNMSHEFRTPLTLILGPLEDLRTGRFGAIPAQARLQVDRIKRNSGRLLGLINQLLDLSSAEAGGLMLQAREQDLNGFVLDVASLFESLADRRRVRFETRLSDNPVRLVFDTDKLEKVLVNLLSNAFKFTPAGGSVVLRVTVLEESVLFTVKDTGIGIAQDKIPQLFDRFFQAEDGTSRRYGGNGIGLTLVKELVELHEGSIEVVSEPGVGSEFRVRIPRTLEPARTDSKAGLEGPVLSRGDGYSFDPAHDVMAVSQDLRTIKQHESTVLLVDDSSDMRAYVKSLMEGSFAVAEARNGVEGMQKAQELVPDLIISDVMMPEMDGLEMCAQLKQDQRTSHIPVIILTAKIGDETRYQGLELGADAYLTKPFNGRELRIRTRKLIEQRAALQKKYSQGVLVMAPREVSIPNREARFMEQVRALIEANLSSSSFGVDQLAEALGMSRRQLLRKMKALLDETPHGLMRRMRMHRAAQLLRRGGVDVQKVARATGFSSGPYFSRLFKEEFGVSPSAYRSAEGDS